MKPSLAIAVLVWMLGAGAAFADESRQPPGHAAHTRPQRNEALRQTLLKMGREDQAGAVLAYKGPVPNAAERAQARVALLKPPGTWSTACCRTASRGCAARCRKGLEEPDRELLGGAQLTAPGRG